MAEPEPPQTTAPAPAEGAPEPNEAGRRTYLGSIKHAAQSIFEGLSITWTEMLRMPQNRTTVQYPDRTPFPVADSLPERYRGFLEVDMDICTACKACERDCPINCIVIDLGKIEGTRAMTRFDIDLGKCMYCGICVDSCPTDAQGAGDAEPTKCIRMTREFEAVTSDFSTLTFRFIRPGDKVVPFKPKKGEIESTRRRGEIAREQRTRAQQYNPAAVRWALDHSPPRDPGIAALVTPEALGERATELAGLVAPIATDDRRLVELVYAQALAQTDCGDCGYADCHAYAAAMVSGADRQTWKCRPGGALSTRDVNLILKLRLGKSVGEAAEAAAEVVRRHP